MTRPTIHPLARTLAIVVAVAIVAAAATPIFQLAAQVAA